MTKKLKTKSSTLPTPVVNKQICEDVRNKIVSPTEVVKPTYSIVELGNLLGYSRQGCRNLLDRIGIPIHAGETNGRYYVFLSDIYNTVPELYESILLTYHILSQLNELRDIKQELEYKKNREESEAEEYVVRESLI